MRAINRLLLRYTQVGNHFVIWSDRVGLGLFPALGPKYAKAHLACVAVETNAVTKCGGGRVGWGGGGHPDRDNENIGQYLLVIGAGHGECVDPMTPFASKAGVGAEGSVMN